MELQHFQPGDADYPPALTHALGAATPPSLSVLGNAALLRGRLLALFCSAKCPGDIILKVYDHAQELRERGVSVISGFHSPVEQECLRILLRGTQPIVICPARGIDGMRLSADWSKGVESGRLLILSPFGREQHRMREDLARRRNEFVVTLADEVLIAHAADGSKMEPLKKFVSVLAKPLRSLDCLG